MLNRKEDVWRRISLFVLRTHVLFLRKMSCWPNKNGTQKKKKKNRGLHLILSHDIRLSLVIPSLLCSFSHNHPFIIESTTLYFAFDSGLDKINSMAQQILLGHPVMHWTRQQLRGGHKREAFANRVMDTHARASRPKKNLEYKINFRAQKRWENRTQHILASSATF